MTRLGAPWDQLDPVLAALRDARQIRLEATFSHLACADEEDESYTLEQTCWFQNVLSHMRSRGIDPGFLHLANSAGLLYHQAIHYQAVRPGITLYGYPPAPESCSVIEKILRHLKLRDPPERPPPPRASTTLECDADFLAWQAASRLFDGID